MANPAGSAIINAVGPISQVVQGADEIPRRYLVIVPGTLNACGSTARRRFSARFNHTSTSVL
jgi:hypothetical protein